MNPDLHDPATWPLDPPASAACAQIAARLIDLGWRPVSEAYTPEPVAAYADPAALCRLEIRPGPGTEGEVTVRVLALRHPDIEHPRPEPDWHLQLTGTEVNADVAVRAAWAAARKNTRRDAYEPNLLAYAVREHGWRYAEHPDGMHYTRAASPGGRTTLTYGPADLLFSGSSAAEPWSAETTGERGQAAWSLRAAAHTPSRVLAAALCDPRTAEQLPAAPQHRLHRELAGLGFTAHLWQHIELGEGGLRHLADVHLLDRRDRVIAVTAATTAAQRAPHYEVAVFGPDTDLHEACCALTRRYAEHGHAAFTHRATPETVLAYVSALTAPPDLPLPVLNPRLLDACAAEIRADRRAHPAWARAAAATYAVFTSYRPDQRTLQDPDSVEELTVDLVSDLLHLADTAGVPEPHHGLLEDAYQAYLTVREGLDVQEIAPPPTADPYDASRTSAHP